MSELQDLLDNKIDNIIIDNFLSAEQISTFLNKIQDVPDWKEAGTDEIKKRLFPDVPIPQYLFMSQYGLVVMGMGETQYLETAKTYNKIWKNLIAECGYDAFEILINYLKNNFHVNISLAKKGGLSYCPLTIRDLATSVLPHADFGPYDGVDWEINKVIKQLAWNIYLTNPGEGGETIVYDQQWTDDVVMDENSYGIKDFNKPIKTIFSPKVGRLVLFNSRNFHAVNKSTQPRIAIGGLLGQTATGDIMAWN
jgi:hypothetical protein